ncbi:hypothetical protein K440DRAFT_24875 [Wilcoxina mikolae CBS 423.85]|nr:hypothetical protein K440DRAFT_24875 [Wilcoxina mikolae CBS 423.85]
MSSGGIVDLGPGRFRARRSDVAGRKSHEEEEEYSARADVWCYGEGGICRRGTNRPARDRYDRSQSYVPICNNILDSDIPGNGVKNRQGSRRFH